MRFNVSHLDQNPPAWPQVSFTQQAAAGKKILYAWTKKDNQVFMVKQLLTGDRDEAEKALQEAMTKRVAAGYPPAVPEMP